MKPVWNTVVVPRPNKPAVPLLALRDLHVIIVVAYVGRRHHTMAVSLLLGVVGSVGTTSSHCKTVRENDMHHERTSIF